MYAKCDTCGSMTNKYYAGDILCSKTCKNAYALESYLLRMEERREKDEANNKKAFQHARNMAGWLSLYKYGNAESKKLAAKAINAFQRECAIKKHPPAGGVSALLRKVYHTAGGGAT